LNAREAYLRLGASLLALGAGGAGVVVATALLRSVPGPVGTASASSGRSAAPAGGALLGGRIATPTEPGFPAPPPGALVFAREAGADALGLAIVPGTPRSLVRVSVVGPNGPGISGLHLAVVLGPGVPVRLSACGAGCYQAEIAARGARRASVRFAGRAYLFSLPAATQTSNASRLVARATVVWRSLKTLVWHERLAGSPTDVLYTVYKAVAPDELSYTITGLSAAVIIGGLRWDRPTPTARWVESTQDPPLTMPVPFWSAVTDARLLGSARVQGRRAWTVSFFDPETPAWFEAEIDERSNRTLELSMVAAAHFMHHLYGPFDAAFRLEPPRNR
jgi:hypothetical protein